MIWWRKRGWVGSSRVECHTEVNGTTIMLRNLPQRRWDHWDQFGESTSEVKKPLEKPLEKPVKWRSEVNKWKARLSLILHFFTSSLLAALWRFVLKALLTRLSTASAVTSSFARFTQKSMLDLLDGEGFHAKYVYPAMFCSQPSVRCFWNFRLRTQTHHSALERFQGSSILSQVRGAITAYIYGI